MIKADAWKLLSLGPGRVSLSPAHQERTGLSRPLHQFLRNVFSLVVFFFPIETTIPQLFSSSPRLFFSSDFCFLVLKIKFPFKDFSAFSEKSKLCAKRKKKIPSDPLCSESILQASIVSVLAAFPSLLPCFSVVFLSLCHLTSYPEAIGALCPFQGLQYSPSLTFPHSA